jgi:hypothetical protein
MPLYSLPALKNASVANGWQVRSIYLPIPRPSCLPSLPCFDRPLSLPCPSPPLPPLSREGCEREGIFVVEGNERGREQELTGQEVTGREQEVTGKGRACFQFAFTSCFLTPRAS